MSWWPDSANLLLCLEPARMHAVGTLSADSVGTAPSELPFRLAAKQWASSRGPARFP